MTQDLKRTVRQWLASERASGSISDPEAEARFGPVFRALDPGSPSAGFAQRVLRSAGLVASPAQVLFRHWAMRTVIAASLLLSGLAMAVVPQAVWAVARTLELAALIDALAHVAIGLVSWIDVGVSIWRILAHVGNAVALAATTPQLLGALLLGTLLATFALRLLMGLTLYHRSSIHADTVRP